METITVNKREHDRLTCKVATLEAEMQHPRNLLQAPAKAGWWKRFWGTAAVAALVVAVFLLSTVSIAGGEAVFGPGGLRGLRGVHVFVEGMKPEAERLGLSKAQIKTDVELRLRKAGVRVLTEEEFLEWLGMPCLFVNINTTINQARTTVTYTIIVFLSERVTLARQLKAWGAIWLTAGGGIVGTKKIREIRGDVADLVEEFINDYLAANPKK